MHTKSIWKVFSHSTDFPTLKNNIKVDTLIIGGGVTGVTLAQLLSSAGHSTVLLEKDKIGEGTSSQSTGNLYVTIDKMLSKLSSKYDNDVVKQVVAARKSAMELIVENVEKHHIDCDLLKKPWYLYSITANDDSIVKKELNAANNAGLDMKEVDVNVNEVPLKISSAIKLENQFQFNPMKYVQGLAKSIDTSTCHIFENSEAKEVISKDGKFLVNTENGTVEAKNVVHATHTPKGVMFIQTLLGPYREYGIACKLKEKIDQKGIFWGYHNKEKFSTRIYENSDEQFLMVIGKPHKVGQAENNSSRIEELENFAKEHFNVEEVIYRWGGQHYRPADMLPYIGEQSKNEYIATGFSTDGLVYGTLSGMMIKDQILAKENVYSKLFDPNRHQPLKAAKEFAKENLNVAKQYFDLIPNFNDDDFKDIPVGGGGIVSKEGKKLAVHRCDDNSLMVKSAYCTHLGCVVNWNNAEKTWDCPCHGSRFGTDGKVLEGPAFKSLEEIKK